MSSSTVSGNISSDKVGNKETKSLNVKVKRKPKSKVNGGRDIRLLEDDNEKENEISSEEINYLVEKPMAKTIEENRLDNIHRSEDLFLQIHIICD